MKYWVLDDRDYKAQIAVEDSKAVISNGLVSRTIAFVGCKTLSYQNLQRNIELISDEYSDFAISVNEKKYYGSCFVFAGAQEVSCLERVPFKRTDTMTKNYVYPPEGKAVILKYSNDELNLLVEVRLEIYDGIPVIMKQLTVKNMGTETITIDNIYTDILKITENRNNIFVDSDFDSSTDFLGLELSKYAKHYARYQYDFLEVAPEFRMNIKAEAGEEIESIVAFELLFGAEYYEQRLIEVKTMYRKIAPWCTDNVLFFHLISNSSHAIRKAVDQCAEIGIEMIIQSFGSGVNMESGRKSYLERIKKAYDYGHKKGIRMGAYTLAYVKNYRPVRGDEALNHDASHICRCLATKWSQKYMKNVLRFIDETGADAVEIDGPYGMLMCSGGKTHLHDDFTDSQYKQWKMSVADWYKEIKKRGVYINAPDWHFLNGTNRICVGYEEIAYSERRQEQLITSRIYYYKGTFSKNPAQGWGFLPLNVYHGGGDEAKFFPTEKNSFDFDWALAQITASGVWPTIRGKKVYDSEKGKEIFKKWVSIFKKYRHVLNGITVHFLPPRIDTDNPSRTKAIDAIMNVLPKGETRGFVMFFNQTDEERTETLRIPVYYTGLTSLENPPAPFPNTKNSDISYPLYGAEIAPLIIRARNGEKRTYITDEKVEDKEIPPLKEPSYTGKKIVISRQDENPEVYDIDSNGNVEFKITLQPMSYEWYVLHPDEENKLL